ncbi:plasmid mobilization protein, partial [Escherichia coli]
RRRAKGDAPLKPRQETDDLTVALLIIYRRYPVVTKKKEKDKVNRDVVISLRLTEKEFSDFVDDIKKSQLSRSAFFRKLILERSSSVVIKVNNTAPLVYHFNKAGNNLNQLAYKVNSAFLMGRISESLYVRVLNALVDIRELLMAGIKNAH